MKRIFALLLPLSLLASCNVPMDPSAPAAGEPDATLLETPGPVVIEAARVAAPQLTSIHMQDEINGWGIAETAVLRTDDGGATWYDLTPSGLSEAGYAVEEFFLDPDHGWILVADQNDFMRAGTLYRTQDGGLNWTSNAVPFGGGDLTFLNDLDGWMLADLGGGAGSNAVAVFQTGDGGSTWTRAYINDPNVEGAGDSLPLGGLKFGLVPRDMQTAWIGGVVYSPGTVYLFRTDDGGETWTPVTLPLPESADETALTFESLQFLTPNDAFLTMRMTGDDNQLAVYVSQDGGDSWSLTPTLIPDGGSVDFVSAEEGVIWSGSQFYVTRDAAQTWSVIPPDILFGETFAQMDFVTSAVGWVITYDTSGRYNLYQTLDSGATWMLLFP